MIFVRAFETLHTVLWMYIGYVHEHLIFSASAEVMLGIGIWSWRPSTSLAFLALIGLLPYTYIRRC